MSNRFKCSKKKNSQFLIGQQVILDRPINNSKNFNSNEKVNEKITRNIQLSMTIILSWFDYFELFLLFDETRHWRNQKVGGHWKTKNKILWIIWTTLIISRWKITVSKISVYLSDKSKDSSNAHFFFWLIAATVNLSSLK